MTARRRFRRWPLLVLLAVVLALVFLATTDNPAIWPARNMSSYRLTRWWEARVGAGQPAGAAVLSGCIRSDTGAPLPGAAVLLSERDGALHQALADASGCYHIAGLPAGAYVPIASATGYAGAAIRPWRLPLRLSAGEQRTLDITLRPAAPPAPSPGANLRVGAPITLTWALPRASVATRRQITYASGSRENQLTFLYTPVVTDSAPLPTLLAVYPGAADLWEGVSIPLAAAGYAVVAIGPGYALDLEDDIDELRRLVGFIRAGLLPGADGRRIVALGGSYSSLHVQRLVAGDTGFCGVVLLGAANDLFDLRQRFEQGSFHPPFGLDQALIALGTPDTSPERYWRYSSRFHLRRDLPPILLMHSRDDEVVPFEQSERLAADLGRLGVAHEMHLFDGMSHYLLADRPSADLDRLYAITTDFLRRVQN
jgi:pimeloyl-ACP methyl ester carboxylesterase